MCFVANTRTEIYHTENCFCNDWLHSENRAVLEERPSNMRPCSFCHPEATSLEEVSEC
ncbi:MAG: hypothetical protein Q4P14_04685 [Methanobacteriaceae archaeon]|nr:hypothetical protein [Methanobacteriaceae archaeon]